MSGKQKNVRIFLIKDKILISHLTFYFSFSMTLVDTLDTLIIIGDYDEFEHAVKLVIDNVKLDNDIIVSVFETNIRMVGGLLSAHVLAELIRKNERRGSKYMKWYRGELLEMAKDLGYRLLPAFNTTTGIPHARVNLKYGMKSEQLKNSRETCTACAGTVSFQCGDICCQFLNLNKIY